MATKILIELNSKNHSRLRNLVRSTKSTNPVVINKLIDSAFRDKAALMAMSFAKARKRGPKVA